MVILCILYIMHALSGLKRDELLVLFLGALGTCHDVSTLSIATTVKASSVLTKVTTMQYMQQQHHTYQE
jgi:hypothetical protein